MAVFSNMPVVSRSRPDLGVLCLEATLNPRAILLQLGTSLIHMMVVDLKKDSTVIPRLTSDSANEFFDERRFFRCFLDSANEYGSG